ncbi:hypothetical protein J3459_008438 [Metarhizium acridum]|nr:hypothetical protein J3459_008438 [Metarhizium acridum]
MMLLIDGIKSMSAAGREREDGLVSNEKSGTTSTMMRFVPAATSPTQLSNVGASASVSHSATKADIEAHFATHGTGDITEVKLMNASASLNTRILWMPETSFRLVEYETAADLRTAVDKLDGREFKGNRVQCIADTQPDMPPRDGRGRSRSPGGRRPYNNMPTRFDEYDRRGPPPRGYNRDPGPYGYRDRSPRREYYEDRARYRSPPRGPAPIEDYPPARGRYEDPYRRDYPPPPPDPMANGRQYDRPPRDFPPREPAYPPRDGYARDMTEVDATGKFHP